MDFEHHPIAVARGLHCDQYALDGIDIVPLESVQVQEHRSHRFESAALMFLHNAVARATGFLDGYVRPVPKLTFGCQHLREDGPKAAECDRGPGGHLILAKGFLLSHRKIIFSYVLTISK